MLIFKKFITREFVKQSFPNTIFLFGDNMQRIGLGGQAKEMRGEPNAFGVPTKWAPTMNHYHFFTDSDYDEVKNYIQFPFQVAYYFMDDPLHNVCLPEDGLGTGLSKLDEKAPKILKLIESCTEVLKSHKNSGVK